MATGNNLNPKGQVFTWPRHEIWLCATLVPRFFQRNSSSEGSSPSSGSSFDPLDHLQKRRAASSVYIGFSLRIHWVFFAAWLLNYWSGRQSGPIPWTWCQKGDKYRWNQMESNGSIIYIQLWEILRPLTGVVSMLWSWIGLLNLIELIGFLYAVECAHSFEYIAIHSHNLPYLCILRIKMYKA